jgi:glutathione S-transferase
MLKVYDAARCPYCARVRIALAEKGVEAELVPVDLDDRPDWLWEKNPQGKVPVLEEDGGLVLPESVVIMEYLEERFPSPRLLPADPAARALARLTVARFDSLLGDAYYAFRRGEAGAEERLAECLAHVDHGVGSYLDAAFGWVDVAFVPWLIRARDMLGVDFTPYRAIEERLAGFADRPSVAAELAVVASL